MLHGVKDGHVMLQGVKGMPRTDVVSRQERREEAEYRNALAYKNIYSNRLLLSFVLDKCSDRSTEVYLPALLV